MPLLAASAAFAAAPPSSDYSRYRLEPKRTVVVPKGGGSAHLSALTPVERPSVTLDFGRNVSGVIEIGFSGASPDAEIVIVPAERRRYLGAIPLGGDMRYDAAGSDDAPRAPRVRPGAGESTYSTPGVMGAQRWVSLVLTSAGSVDIDWVRLRYTPYRPAGPYPGWFLSSDPELNRIWFASAYTEQLNHRLRPEVILDGAKRDRLVWAGDLVVAGPTELLTTARRRAVRNSLRLLAAGQHADGYIPANAEPSGADQSFAGLVLPSYVALWAVTLEDYWMRTGDERFTRAMLAPLRKGLAWLRTRRAAGSPLIELRGGDLTWHPPDAPLGLVGETNAAWYGGLRAAALLEAALGSKRRALALRKEAGRVRRAFNRRLALPGGLYALSGSEQVAAHDTTAAAAFHGLAVRPRASLRGIRRALWTELGPTTVAQAHPGMARFISPYIASLELIARGRAGDAAGGIDLLRRTWRHFDQEDPAGSDWERLGLDGEPEPYPMSNPQAGRGFTSLAHAWSTGPVRFLTEHVLGVRPLEPGYRRYEVAPQPSGLRWARGRVPTPRGPIDVSWVATKKGLKLSVRGPAGSRAQNPRG